VYLLQILGELIQLNIAEKLGAKKNTGGLLIITAFDRTKKSIIG
tara:strand:+ start:277 stop:408 length:132 start_codon:yes stop_codon:yes gene_type:complete